MEVLVIENNFFFRQLLKKSGKKEGINVDVAVNSSYINKNKKYDLIVFDYLASQNGQQEQKMLESMFPEAQFIHYCTEKPENTNVPFVNKFQFKNIRELLIARKTQCTMTGNAFVALT